MRYLLPILFLFICCSACQKEDQTEVDQVLIEQYILDNNLNTTKTDSGLHYIIGEEGTGEHPDVFATVDVDYVGYFMDGDEFDSGVGIQFQLTNVISGWTEGIQKFKKQGGGTLIVPSHLAYGKNGRPGIPSNSILLFDITLNNFW